MSQNIIEQPAAPSAPDGLLKHPAFLWFWTSRVLMAMGFQITSVAIGCWSKNFR